jgi:linoleoyl-CoA desaturase
MRVLKFSNNLTADFGRELRSQVKTYFEEKGISKFGNMNMLLKTIFMVSLYMVPYILMISGIAEGVFFILLMWILMGFGAAGIGLSVMHDANHRSYSRSKTINAILGHLLNLIGGHAPTWEIQHNMLHHGYTNIEGFDEDIDAGALLRFSPNKPLYKIHRYQYIYAWILYCFMTVKWITTKDFMQMFQFRKEGFIPGSKLVFARKILFLGISKLLYFLYILVIPAILLPVPWWAVLIFFFIMHGIAGFLLSIIFQSAHVVPSSVFPLPDSNNSIRNNWIVHQIITTTDFSPRSRIFSWLIGGLNYQIEHHLFPNICHVHYCHLSKIVRETTAAFHIRYNVQSTFFKAVINHGRMLKQLGRA